VEIHCPAGSMVLWDSRTIHSARGPLRGRNYNNSTTPPTSGMRAVYYVCLAPRNRCTSKMLEKRVKLFEEGRMTFHHPYHVKCPTKYPRKYNGDLPQVNSLTSPLLTELGMRMVGYE